MFLSLLLLLFLVLFLLSVLLYLLSLLCCFFFFFLFLFTVSTRRGVLRNKFAKDCIKIYENNEEEIFKIQKILLCSSANAIDSTEEQKLENLDLYQYTDIAVYINNYKEEGLTNKNTVRQLYIDNINLKLDYNIGKTSLVYTNLLKIGSKEQLNNMIANSENIQNDKIDFNIINTNEQNNQADYEEPTFYADCSNPISLKYINQINKEYSVGKDNSATFDGSILEKAGIKPEDINVQVKFKINLVNNNDEYYSNWVNFRIPLNDVMYNGTSIKSRNTVGREYNFFTI